MPGKNNNTSEIFKFYENEKSTLKKQDIQENNKDLIRKIEILKLLQKIVCQSIIFNTSFLHMCCYFF